MHVCVNACMYVTYSGPTFDTYRNVTKKHYIGTQSDMKLLAITKK